MGSEWRDALLGDVVELKRGYDLPKQQRKPGAIPVISSSGVSDRHAESKVTGPGVVTGRYGTIGEVFYCSGDFWPLNTALYVKDFKGNDVEFVYYFLKTINYVEYSDKAAVPGVNRNHLHMAKVRVPTLLSVQRKIAGILRALDNKIELNRQTNQTLESMAQALFKSWFVDFDPVIDNALAAGNEIPEPLAAKAAARRALQEQGTDKANQPHTLPDHILQLFPSRFQFTEELGWIPEGWEVSGFETLAKLDTTSVKPNLEPDRVWEHYSIPAFDIDQMPVLDSGDDIKSNKYRVNQNAILCSKLNPHVPRIWWFESSNEEAAVCSTEFMQFVPVDPRIRAFLYGLITSKPFQEGIKERVTGSTGSRQRAQPRQVAVMNVLIPSEQLMIAYSEAAEQFLTKQQANRQANLSLGFTRDALLPKLLSGELRIPEAKKELDEALA